MRSNDIIPYIMQSIISKLNILKSIEPEKSWVVETRKKVLSETPVLNWKVTEIKSKQESNAADKFFSRRDGDLSRLGKCDELRRDERRDKSPSLRHVYAALFSKRLAVSAFALVFLVSGGAFTVEASKSSLPGDPLYIVKITAEDVTLAVAPEDKKAEVEIRQVEKRREELGKISKNHSDPKQGEKVKMLLGEIEVKTNNSKEYLTKIKDDGVKAKIAKVINIQTEKCAEALAETSANLSDVVKDEVSEKLASVIESNEKVNFDSLATMVELMTVEDQEEITAIVKEKVEEKINKEESETEENITENEEDAGTGENFDESDSTDQAVIETETETETEESTDSIDNKENGAEESEETDVTMEDTKKELLGIIDDLNNPDDSEGAVKGDSCVCEVDVECDCAGEGDELDGEEVITEESTGLEEEGLKQ